MDITSSEVWLSLLTLTLLEIVLGIDNIIFISLTTSRLPLEKQKLGRTIGLGLALLMRIALLAAISWVVQLTDPIFEAMGKSVSWRDVILLTGGLFLLTKATLEIHSTIEGVAHGRAIKTLSFWACMGQIIVLDVVFSLDSVITAVGMAEDLGVMIAAVMIAVLVMLFASHSVSSFIERHPTAKMLALSFLLLIGVALVADGLHFHIPRGYLYFAVAFSCLVEVLNITASQPKSVGKHDM